MAKKNSSYSIIYNTGEEKTLSRKNSVREKFCRKKFCPNPYFAWEKLLSHPAGSGKYIDRREAPKNFEGDFAYNWSLCVGKIQPSLSWPGKILPILKKAGKYCPEIWDRIFPTGVFPGRSFSLPGN